MSHTEAVAAVRRFNRFYTQRLGILRDGYLQTPFSLTEARVLYELAHRQRPTASDLIEQLGLDAGYLSRILRRFQQQGLIRKETSRDDARRSHLCITPKGREAYAPLEAHANEQVDAMIEAVAPERRDELLGAMRSIEDALHHRAATDRSYILRAPRPGDLGWLVSRHATFYREHYGWREPLEGMCAQIVADFANNNDPRRERCWIAERNGQNVGSVLLMKGSEDIARLRLLLVEPSAQGLGIGSSLVDACIAFGRQAGYKRITLWTHQVLTAARKIYRRKGFALTESKPHESWGVPLIGETWDLDLT